MVLKYDFNITSTTGNMFVDSLIYINNAIDGLIIYGIVLFVFLVASVVFILKSNDTNLSIVRSGLIACVVSTIFFYMGVVAGVTFFSGAVLLALWVLLSVGIGLLYYERNTLSGGG